MSLSEVQVRNAKPRESAYKVSDADGLYVFVTTTGSRLWRMDYRFNGKRKTLSLGVYPTVGLADARKKCQDARRTLDSGVDPSAAKKLNQIAESATAANTFKLVAEEFIEKQRAAGKAPATISKKEWFLLDLASDLAERPIGDIKPFEILSVLQRVERKGHLETANRMRSAMSAVFRLAVSTLRAETDPTQVLRGAIAAPVVESHAAITDEIEFGALVSSIEAYTGWPTVRGCLRFTMLTAARPGEVRLSKWSEFNDERTLWTIPAERTKMRREHTIPMSKQATAILLDIEQLTSRDDFVFASIRSGKKAISENGMNSALKRMGYRNEDHVSHGFRSSFSTIMNGRGFNSEHIEVSLAHIEAGVRKIYNRALYLPERTVLMQEWADLVDKIKAPIR